MHDIVCSDIRIIELKLKRIKLCKERLLKNKPSSINQKKYMDWNLKLEKIEQEEREANKELQEAYVDLEKYL